MLDVSQVRRPSVYLAFLFPGASEKGREDVRGMSTGPKERTLLVALVVVLLAEAAGLVALGRGLDVQDQQEGDWSGEARESAGRGWDSASRTRDEDEEGDGNHAEHVHLASHLAQLLERQINEGGVRGRWRGGARPLPAPSELSQLCAGQRRSRDRGRAGGCSRRRTWAARAGAEAASEAKAATGAAADATAERSTFREETATALRRLWAGRAAWRGGGIHRVSRSHGAW